MTDLPSPRHTVKPGTPEHGTAEHGTPAERQNNAGTTEHHRNTTGTRNNGTRNTSGIAKTPWSNGGIPEQRNTTKLEPEDKHGIFTTFNFH